MPLSRPPFLRHSLGKPGSDLGKPRAEALSLRSGGNPMRHLASTTLAVFALAMGAPGVSLALPLAGGVDRAVAAAAPASAQALLINDQPRRKRTTVVRRSPAFPFYPNAPVPSAGVVVSNGYPA